MRLRVSVVALALLVGCRSGDKAKTAPAENSLDLRRVMVIGASMTAGFGGARLDTLLDSAIKVPHEMGRSSTIFFSQKPLAIGKRQLKRTLAFKPTLVIALDYLFWYAYVDASRAVRSQRVADALAQLGQIRVTLILGDIADMRGADPAMLPRAMVPSPAELAAFNRQIRAWAETRPNAHIVPLSTWSRPLLTGELVVVRPGAPPIPATELVAADRLHPNTEGMGYVVRQLIQNLVTTFPGTPKNALRFTQ